MISSSTAKINASPLAYRAALALNNMATTLILKGSYSQALKTLTESLAMIKAAFSHRNAKELDVDKIFQAACRRFTRAVGRQAFSDMDINVLDDDDFAELRAAARYGTSSSVAFPIRISESLCHGETDSAQVARQLGIILYNHGLAGCLVASKTMNEKSLERSAQLDKASKSLQMADETFSRLLENESQADDEHCDEAAAVVEPSLVLFSALVLNCLSLVFEKQDMQSEAEEAQEIVSSLQCSIDNDGFSSEMIRRQTAPAA